MAADYMQWFREAKFGMFIHWGLYSVWGRDAGSQHGEALPAADYAALTEGFRPDADCAARWARLAKRAGARYVVFVTKHHDGYCLFDSQQTDFTSVKQGPGRDFVREVTDAVRAEGLRVGLYYSLPDWHNPDYLTVANGNRTHMPQLQRYIREQVRELLSNYGQIDVLWYDGPAYAAPEYGDDGYLPPEIIDAAGLNALARELQPGIVINDRSMLPADYDTPENACNPAPLGRDWEMCVCINDLWGYHPHDHNYKTRNQLLFLLAQCATQGGNLLLNIGPRGDGSVPEAQVARMEALGDWLRVHGEAVYGVERLRDPFFNSGRVTRQGNRLYLHTFYWPGEVMRVPRLSPEIHGVTPGVTNVRATVLTTGQPAETRWEDGVLVISGLPETPPDAANTVVALDILSEGER